MTVLQNSALNIYIQFICFTIWVSEKARNIPAKTWTQACISVSRVTAKTQNQRDMK